jgi:Glycosyltransferase family 87
MALRPDRVDGVGSSNSSFVLIDRVVRAVALVLLAWVLYQVVTLRTDLLHPLDIGSDSWTYAAAGQRVFAGHPLYALAAGDRPVFDYNPPFWSVPILSPPGAGLLWTLPASIGLSAQAIDAWWIAGAILTLGWTTVVLVRGPLAAAVLAVAVGPLTALTALSGNLNALLMPLLVVTWYLAMTGESRRREFLAGLMVGVGAWTKLTPILLLPWFIACRRWSAVAGAIVGLGVLGLAGLVVGGWDAHVAYLSIGRQAATAGATGPGPTSLLLQLGIAPGLAALAPLGIAGSSAALMALLRDRPKWGFVVAVVAATLVLPVLRLESYSMLVAVAAPWVSLPTRKVNEAGRGRSLVAGVLVVVLVSTGLLAAQGVVSTTSSISVTNRSGAPIVVRFALPDQSASFGFGVPAAASGSGWRDQPGGFRGDVIVFDASCRQVLRQTISAGDIDVEVGPAGQVTVTQVRSQAALSLSPGQVLSFTSECGDELGPFHL